MAKQASAQPLYNKLAFRGYHIEGQFDNSVDGCWDDFHDHYPTLSDYTRSFSPCTTGVLSPRELYQQQLEDGYYRNLVIRNNGGEILWNAEIEAEAKRVK